MTGFLKPGTNEFSGRPVDLAMAGELFMQRLGVKLLHVPYKGSAPATTPTVNERLTTEGGRPSDFTKGAMLPWYGCDAIQWVVICYMLAHSSLMLAEVSRRAWAVEQAVASRGLSLRMAVNCARASS